MGYRGYFAQILIVQLETLACLLVCLGTKTLKTTGLYYISTFIIFNILVECEVAK